MRNALSSRIVRVARRVARAAVHHAYWTMVDTDVQDELAYRLGRGMPPLRTALWAGAEYLSVVSRLLAERVPPSWSSESQPMSAMKV